MLLYGNVSQELVVQHFVARSMRPGEKERLSLLIERWERAVIGQKSYVDRLIAQRAAGPVVAREREHLQGLQATLFELQEQLKRLR